MRTSSAARRGLLTAVWGLWFLATMTFVLLQVMSNVYYHRAASTGFWAWRGFVPESLVQPENLRPVVQGARVPGGRRSDLRDLPDVYDEIGEGDAGGAIQPRPGSLRSYEDEIGASGLLDPRTRAALRLGAPP